MKTATEAQQRALTALDRAYGFAKRLDDAGPEYGSEGAAAAFAVVAGIVRHHAPKPSETAEEWCRRVADLARQELAVHGNRTPAAFEALAMIRAD